MKYPQLVSTRAVNAISDWLVSRLEQLGVEAPQPYTRLLLSLLQSTIQLNDPIELSNLESFLASRKGGNRRYQNCDTDALKKFNAVQCLKEIVSSEQEIAAVENLVDELCEKLKDIEKQIDDNEDEHKLFVATLNLTQQTQSYNNHIYSHHSHKSHHNHQSHQTKEISAHKKNFNFNKGSISEGGGKQPQPPIEGAGTSIKKSTTEEKDNCVLDPFDLYRRAFPALSKEMENSFLSYRRNVKWLTWPLVEQQNQREHVISISSSSSTISSNSATEGDGSAKDKKTLLTTTNKGNVSKIPRQELADINSNASGSIISIVGGIKRKTKRRRSRALSKGKPTLTACPTTFGSASASTQNNGGSTANSGKNKRNASPAYWDTDFEGCWEMGRDLIKEFRTRQNRNSRNRSTSESAVSYNKKNLNEANTYMKKTDSNEKKKIEMHQGQIAEVSCEIKVEDDKRESLKDTTVVVTPVLLPVVVDFSFCDYDDYDDTLASVSELTNAGSYQKPINDNVDVINTATVNRTAKRLYERELMPKDMQFDERNDFAQFEAKFNSSVEALWKDAAATDSGGDEKGFKSIGNDDKMHVFSGFGSTHFSGPSSLPCDIPFRQNLKNFWTNYYNHHFDLNKMLQASLNLLTPQELDEMMRKKANDDNNINSDNGDRTEYNKFDVGVLSNLPEKVCNFPHTTQMETYTTSDYFSMPNTLGSMMIINKTKSQRCSLRHNSASSDSGGNGSTLAEERKTPIALFLQSSIWSENANLDGGDTDESFFYKVHNSGKQLNQYDNKTENNNNFIEKKSMKNNNNNDNNNVGGNNNNSTVSGKVGPGFVFTTPYTGSKWSEGINAGPPTNIIPMVPPTKKHQQKCAPIGNNKFNICGTDCTDSASSAAMAMTVVTNTATAAAASASALPTTTFTIGNNNWKLIKDNTQSNLQNTWPTSSQTINIAMQQEQQQRTPASGAARFVECEAKKTHVLKPKITLANHSPTSSGFIAYSRIKSVLQLQLPKEENATAHMFKQQPPQQQFDRNYTARVNSKETQQQQHQRYKLDMIEDEENLLTSERTHFHPIKSYTDGHTFDICSELDVIDYQRSGSGYLYLEQEKYLEYTRTDNFMVEDDGGSVSVGVGVSTNPLYANSNCEAATAVCPKSNYNNNKNKVNGVNKFKRIEQDFVVKFRLQRTEIACQTDVIPPIATRTLIGGSSTSNKRQSSFGLNITTTNHQSHPLSLIFSNAAKNLKANVGNQLVYSDTVEAFTRAMAHFPPPPLSTSAQNSIWLPLTDESSASASGIWNIYQHKRADKINSNKVNNEDYNPNSCDDGYDDVDFFGSIAKGPDVCERNSSAMEFIDTDIDMTSLEQEWSMNEIRRKCKEAGHMTAYTNDNANNTKNNNNNAVAESVDGLVIESVWDMCAACNSELKSIPANRLLRDELQVEADEIMSDLKYMQDLYIGRADDDDDGDGDDNDNEDDAGDADDEEDDDYCADGYESGGADTVTSDSDWCAEDLTGVPNETCVHIQQFSPNTTANIINEISLTANENPQKPTSMSTAIVTADNNTANNDSDNLTVIQKVNRLIAELLRPENNNDVNNMHTGCEKLSCTATTLTDAISSTTVKTSTTTTSQFSGNLWHTNNNERNIWQLNASDKNTSIKFSSDMDAKKLSNISGIHPIEILRQFNVKPIEGTKAVNVDNIISLPAVTAGEDKRDTTQMSWEHENLAKIWQMSPTNEVQPQQQKSQPQQIAKEEKKK